MKKLVLLAVSAIIVASVGAQESNASKADNKRAKKECQMSKEQRIERDIQTLSEELYLSDEQAAKFAVTYREFMAEKAKLNEKFKAKFAKNLNERQVEKVLHFHGHRKGDFRKHDFRKGDFRKRGSDSKRQETVRK